MSRPSTTTKQQPPRNAPVWLKVLVVFHLACITIWATPNPRPEVMEGKAKPVGTEHYLEWNRTTLKSFSPVPLYLFVSGFWQYWDMFSPNPAQTDIWLQTEVEYKDGTRKNYPYPRIYNLPIPQKFMKERYRKFNERVNQEQYSYLWPVVGQRVAVLSDDPKNPPVVVRLTRHWREVDRPGQPKKPEQQYSSYMYYEYVVDQKRLASARAGR